MCLKTESPNSAEIRTDVSSDFGTKLDHFQKNYKTVKLKSNLYFQNDFDFEIKNEDMETDSASNEVKTEPDEVKVKEEDDTKVRKTFPVKMFAHFTKTINDLQY